MTDKWTFDKVRSIACECGHLAFLHRYGCAGYAIVPKYTTTRTWRHSGETEPHPFCTCDRTYWQVIADYLNTPQQPSRLEVLARELVDYYTDDSNPDRSLDWDILDQCVERLQAELDTNKPQEEQND